MKAFATCFAAALCLLGACDSAGSPGETLDSGDLADASRADGGATDEGVDGAAGEAGPSPGDGAAPHAESEDGGTDATSPVCSDCGADACAEGDCKPVSPCATATGDVSCDHLDGLCLRGVCDPTLGCVAVVEAGCDCDDGNACTEDTLKLEVSPGEAACRHTLLPCADDGVACTVEVCKPDLGCQHEPDPDQCRTDNPCLTHTCDLTQGCASAPVDDGAACGWTSCGRSRQCQDGACVTVGAFDAECESWFTPGENEMLPWGVAVNGSATGNGMDVASNYDSRGTYMIWSRNDMMGLRSGDLLYTSGGYWGARIFDGEDWSTENQPAMPEEYGYGWRVLGELPNGELVLLREDANQPCVQALRVDRQAGTIARWAESMFADDFCAATGGTDGMRYFRVYLGTDGALWTFNTQGLLRFEGGTWQAQPFPDGAWSNPQPRLVFDDQGLAWVIGTKEHYAWRRRGSEWESVALPAGTADWPYGAVDLTPSGSLLLSTFSSVLELTDDAVIEYPSLVKDERYGVGRVVSDAYGRPVIGTGYGNWDRYLFQDGAWKPLGFAELVARSKDFRVFRADRGLVTQRVGERWLPVGPQDAHRSINRQSTFAPYALGMEEDGIQLHWLYEGPYAEAGSVHVQRTQLVEDKWETEGLEMDAEHSRCSRYGRRHVVSAHGQRALWTCNDQWAGLFAGDEKSLLDFPQAAEPSRLSADGLASTVTADGDLLLAYVVGDPEAAEQQLYLAWFDEDDQVSRSLLVPGARITGLDGLLYDFPRVDLAVTAEGLLVSWFWQGENGSAARVRQGKLLVGDTWEELGELPDGKAFVDPAGALWIAAYTDGADGGVTPNRLTATGWEPVAGGFVKGAFPNVMAFDADGNPILVVLVGQSEFGVVRHENGAWEPVHDSLRAGGVTNSPRTLSRDPVLARKDDLLCLGWLEPVDAAFELLVRCTQLP